MDELGMIIRTHGGAILPTVPKDVYEYKERMNRESEGKRHIGRHAASLIHKGDYVIMDASTTVQIAAEHVSAERVEIVTNSIDIADTLSAKDKVKIHLLGGELHKEHRFLYGPSTIAKLADYHVDKLFLGACRITEDGLSYPYEDEGALKREMIRRTDQVIVLADHTKFGTRMFYKVAGLDSIDLIITDKYPNQKFMDTLHRNNVEIVVVTEEEENND
jgi:DeoR/GlpR family transcriptional regulator of sugar metabolism